MVVGACYDNDGGFQRGSAWILFMNTNGTVKSHQKISSTAGNFTGNLDANDRFVTVSLIEDVRRLKKIPFAYIEKNNVKSINLVKKLGFIRQSNRHWFELD